MTNAQHPLISVVIPTYNQASLLRLALQSVMAQTHQNWEAIVINNHSSDDTENVVRSIHDQRISLINFANNGIIAASRNLGIQQARGEYVAFLDSDDTWVPRKLEICLKQLVATHSDGVCHNEYQVRNGVRERVLRYGPKANFVYQKLLFNGNCVSTSALLIRRDQLLKANLFSEDKSINTAEDYDLWLRLSKNGCRLLFLSDVLGDYLIHSSNNSAAVSRHFNAVFNVVQSHFQNLLKDPGSNSHRKHLLLRLKMRLRTATLWYGAARHAQAQGNKKDSKAYYLQSIRLNPLRLKTIFGFFLLFLKPTQGSSHAS